MMNIQNVLAELGVDDNTLSMEEKAKLDNDGFLPLYGIISPAQLEAFRQRLAQLLEEEGEDAGKEVHQEAGADRLSDLINKDPIFEMCFRQPRVLAAVAHVLGGEFKLSSLNFRAALPGYGTQGLHADWKGAVTPGDYFACNSIWLLDDFTEDNGPTRIVPGSQRSGKVPSEVMSDTKSSYPDEVKLLAPAGTVVVFNSHTWHGGTLNTSASPRRAMHCYFVRRDQPQQLDQRQFIREETSAHLSEAERYLLDVL